MIKITEGWHAEIFLTKRGTIIKKFKPGLEKNFYKECYFLKKLQNYNFVPRLLRCYPKSLEVEMEYIEGTAFGKLIRLRDIYSIRQIILKILDILYLLDISNIQKEELNRPHKHIIINGERIVLIDWERAKETNKPSNITQFISFLVNCRDLNKMGIPKSRESILELSRNYKISYSRKILGKIKSVV